MIIWPKISSFSYPRGVWAGKSRSQEVPDKNRLRITGFKSSHSCWVTLPPTQLTLFNKQNWYPICYHWWITRTRSYQWEKKWLQDSSGFRKGFIAKLTKSSKDKFLIPWRMLHLKNQDLKWISFLKIFLS